MNKSLFFFIVILWVMFFLLASESQEVKPLPKASSFNDEIKARNQGDERATFYDKQTVRNILKAGCLPVIPQNTNQNISSLCSQS